MTAVQAAGSDVVSRSRGDWWRGGTIYHAYVRSFRDFDGDGYGDLRGLIEGVDYLSDLGITALWMSPIMPSPNKDWGYDVADYCDVHPDLGSLADLDELLAVCAGRGIKVVLDKTQTKVSVKGTDRQPVGQLAAQVRAVKEPEPYKGKGIKYVEEIVRRKVGKAGAK